LEQPRGDRPAASETQAYRFFAARVDFRVEDFGFGTFAPFSRASLRPIAIACFRLFTVRPDPLLSVPVFRRCIADFTLLPAPRLYFAIRSSDPVPGPRRALVAIGSIPRANRS